MKEKQKLEKKQKKKSETATENKTSKLKNSVQGKCKPVWPWPITTSFPGSLFFPSPSCSPAPVEGKKRDTGNEVETIKEKTCKRHQSVAKSMRTRHDCLFTKRILKFPLLFAFHRWVRFRTPDPGFLTARSTRKCMVCEEHKFKRIGSNSG